LEEHFGIPRESLWQSTVELITLPPLNSQIISEFTEIFTEFQRVSERSISTFCDGTVAPVSKQENLAADVRITQTL
jgi:hypothetical protein